MSSGIYVSVEIKSYVKRYFECRYGSPVKFPRRSDYNRLLEKLISKRPRQVRVSPGGAFSMSIELPFFESKNISSYNYLSKNAEKKLKAYLYNDFCTELYCVVQKLQLKEKTECRTAIEMFIEKYGIDVSAFETLAKIIYRSKKFRQLSERFVRRASKNKSLYEIGNKND